MGLAKAIGVLDQDGLHQVHVTVLELEQPGGVLGDDLEDDAF